MLLFFLLGADVFIEYRVRWKPAPKAAPGSAAGTARHA
jgi:hypothetical protein